MNYRKYLEITRIGFMQATAYRFNALMAVLTSVFFLVFYYFIWSAIAASGQLNSSLNAVLSYVVLGQIISSSVFVSTEDFIGEKIQEGTIANELKRPISLRAQTYFFKLGQTFFFTLARGVPIAILGFTFLGISFPTGWNAVGFIISVIFSMNLVFALSYLVSMLIFWTKVSWSLRMMRGLVQDLFSGIIFPLYLLPESIAPIFNALPFQAMADGPIQIFQENITGWAMAGLFGKQIAWTIAILIAGELMWRKAKQKLTVQGG